MPLYICNTRTDVLDAGAKQAIAEDITRIHCSATGAPACFVHVAFFEEAPLIPLQDKTLSVRGTIRKGRTEEKKNDIAQAIKASLIKHSERTGDHVEVAIQETPASWVLEGGEIMPEPGEEADWLAAQETRRALEA